MQPVLFVIAATAGALGAVALGALVAVPLRLHAARALLGAVAGAVGAPLLVAASLAGRAPRAPVTATAGIDVGGLLGVAASGALCAIVVALVATYALRLLRRDRR